MYKIHLVTLYFESYVAQPYWPEANSVIDIQKKSGMNRVRTDAKREGALKAYLDNNQMTMEQYRELLIKSKRPWYRVNPDDPKTEIIIPRHQFSGCLVETCKRSPATVIKTDLADNLRTLIRVSDFGTGKLTHDELFQRYVKSDESNQRRYQEDPVIKNFEARGSLTFDPDTTTIKTVENTLKYALANIGVGGCRKMGYGRGKVLAIKVGEEVESPIDAPVKVPAA